MTKIVWTLVRRKNTDATAFATFALTELALGVTKLIKDVTDASIILQDPGAFSRSDIEINGEVRSVDAIISVTVASAAPAVDAANAYLNEHCDFFQGWFVKPTLIFDASKEIVPGAKSAFPRVCCFITRLDGTTEEHFHRNWYIHAGHLDGREEPSEQSLAERRREQEAAPGWSYTQNRFLEAITPTAWVSHGFTQLVMPNMIPGTGEPYDRVRGEAPFEKWPPRIVQGYEHRLDLNAISADDAKKLAGGVAVVTGGAGLNAGLGRGLVRRFADIGMRVAVLDRDAVAAQKYAHELCEQGVDAIAIAIDVTDHSTLTAAAQMVRERFGGCNVLCAHVGGGGQGRFEELDIATWRTSFELMSVGTVATVQAFLPLMRETEGYRRIVLTSSVAALLPGQFQGPYRAAKAAVTSIGETLNFELSGEGIGTTVVFPSGMGDAAMVALVEQVAANGGMNDLLPNDPVTATIAKELASDRSDICTGEDAAAPVVSAVLRGDQYVITHGLSVLEGSRERQHKLDVAFAGLIARGFRATSPVVKDEPAVALDGPPSALVPIGDLLDDPLRKAVIEKHLPGFTDNPQITMARAFTLSAIRPFAPNDLTDAVIAAIDNDLQAIA